MCIIHKNLRGKRAVSPELIFDGNRIIITNAFMKKQQKLPKPEKDRALRYKSDYENRVQKGEYYGQEDQK